MVKKAVMIGITILDWPVLILSHARQQITLAKMNITTIFLQPYLHICGTGLAESFPHIDWKAWRYIIMAFIIPRIIGSVQSTISLSGCRNPTFHALTAPPGEYTRSIWIHWMSMLCQLSDSHICRGISSTPTVI